jgi:HK97 gp10 family phage protein
MSNAVFHIEFDKQPFLDGLEEMKGKVEVVGRKIVERGGLLIATKARENFRPYPGGKTVSKNKPWNPRFQSHIGRVYYSFAPPFQAAPPLVTRRSGLLQTSIKVQSVLKTLGGWASFTGTTTKYAPYVEYGTGRMKKEPFMEQALTDSIPEIMDLANEEWAKAMEE